jgi:peroxiredoxin
MIIRIVLFCFFLVNSLVLEAQALESFSLENLSGEWQTLDDLKGSKATIVDFWATWCKPCTKAMPKLDDMYLRLQDSGLSVIGISCDGPRSIGQVRPLVSSMKLSYHILKDIDCEVMNAHDFQAFPTLVLLNEKGEIEWVHEGYRSGDEKDIEVQVMRLLR